MRLIYPRAVVDLTRTVALPERLRCGLSKRCSYTCTRLLFPCYMTIFPSIRFAADVMEGDFSRDWFEFRVILWGIS